EVNGGRFEKVVLARRVLVEANDLILVADVLERLRALYPACTVFSMDGFVGASPELLVRRSGRAVTSHPLAGTVPRSGHPEADGRRAELTAGVGIVADSDPEAELVETQLKLQALLAAVVRP